MTTVTKEWLQQTIAEFENTRDDIPFGLSDDDAKILIVLKRALASLDAEPVAWTSEGALAEVYCGETGVIGPKYIVGDIPLYRHAQPVPVDKEFIPKNLDKALGVVGVALPESKEEFNFQIERWIQRLIDRVIRYANEFKEQPVPVVPEERPSLNNGIVGFDEGWNACRAAMLNGGKS
ncbi:DUF550 domain-containing protein [Salmonella enterica subsp. enterica serovar Chester]|uniref:DUF550 domain-containing protein n=1 Tax=Salmonella enterica subsp. enterica serovar Chester TaxID=149386 RepID=A0A4U8IHW6_SALET|nr:DUF550 domain-containing protein [Salmonella enterica]EDQ9571872.1 DUF550 domain-containing protein [Salmonella enterica subsp. enterica]EDT5076948.1 DUF550 domain-containing protein [Salmonella enterica subsp. enterica serovar Nottingham]EAA4340716.1 DUF550 domain-containing protein [Salmonella enterica subsp. enterica serovar Chester]EAB9280721.1 DUF550 domain-containing protein [Salmonella enterica subsp. enterica serovar Chester]EAQ9901182.1 DUF550 domain-containing protein [Salmonella 